MSNRDSKTTMRYPHRVDILEKDTITNQAGQKVASWSVAVANQKCYYIPSRALIRVTPSAEETEKIMIFFPSDAPIDFTTRFSNLHDYSGNEFPHLVGKTFEVVEINHFSNYRGKPHHIQCRVETVTE